MIPYGKHYIDSNDIEAVVEILKSDWITTGPKVEEFEGTISELSSNVSKFKSKLKEKMKEYGSDMSKWPDEKK